MKQQSNPLDNAEVISVYTRQQAIDDGVLVDISDNELAKNAGFKVPVCITRTVYNLCEVPEELKGLQDFNGRLWDILFLAVMRFKGCMHTCHTKNLDPAEYCNKLEYYVDMRLKPDKNGHSGIKCLKFIIAFNSHEGFTIMRPEDD